MMVADHSFIRARVERGGVSVREMVVKGWGFAGEDRNAGARPKFRLRLSDT
ncbi:hypothetical protein HanIR_Chr14g0691041 [Helianthus annuus]|nr:hypothetical protein HanIR_Chr14g0691041 [Helianthus annuus]